MGGVGALLSKMYHCVSFSDVTCVGGNMTGIVVSVLYGSGGVWSVLVLGMVWSLCWFLVCGLS